MRLPSSTRGAVTAALLACSLASAQDESSEQLQGFDLERLDTNVGRGTLLVGNGELMVPGGLSINLMGHYQRLPLTLNDGVEDVPVVRGRATSLLSASYGVLSWLEVGAQVPFVLWQQGDDPTQLGLARLSAQGLGTPMIQARLGLMSQRYRQPIDLAADLGVGLPVGTEPALAGDSGPRFLARLVAGTNLGWLHPSLEAGVLFRPAISLDTSSGAAKTGASSEIRLGAAAATTGKGLRGELALRAMLAPQVSMELIGGARFPLLVGLDAFVQGGPGLGGAPGTPRFRALVGVSYRSEPPPRISIIEENADREFQLTMAKPPEQPEDNRVRPTGTWEFNRLTRDDARKALAESASQEPLRPYQPTAQERLVLRGQIPFQQGSAELSDVVPLLDQAALRLLEQPKGGLIIIEGHADTEGTDSTDLIMSLRRAQAVRRYLLAQGLRSSQVQIRGFGSEWPVSSQPATDQERQLNRRAEVLVITGNEAATATTQVP